MQTQTRQSAWAVSPPCRLPSYTHRHHLLMLLSWKADAHLTDPQRVEGWVDLSRDGSPTTHRRSPIPVLSMPDVDQLCRLRPMRCVLCVIRAWSWRQFHRLWMLSGVSAAGSVDQYSPLSWACLLLAQLWASVISVRYTLRSNKMSPFCIAQSKINWICCTDALENMTSDNDKFVHVILRLLLHNWEM